jgi:hypothetical protein
MDRRSIENAIQSSMQEKGWSLRSVCNLKRAFVREAMVTPYFRCSELRRTATGGYAIEGIIGVVHAGFEESWRRHAATDEGSPGFGAMLNIANVRELSEKSWIHADADVSAVEPFCSAMAAVLEQLPGCEEDLVKAFQANQLYRFEVDQFAGWAHREKFFAFKEFVRAPGACVTR